MLFLFRYYCRSIYGLSETLVGLIVAASRVWNNDIPASDPSLYLAILTAGVYLVVRGLDNIYQGIVSQPRDRVVDVLMRRMERDMMRRSRLGINEAQ